MFLCTSAVFPILTDCSVNVLDPMDAFSSRWSPTVWGGQSPPRECLCNMPLTNARPWRGVERQVSVAGLVNVLQNVQTISSTKGCYLRSLWWRFSHNLPLGSVHLERYGRFSFPCGSSP